MSFVISYVKCSSCKRIIYDPKMELTVIPTPCPKCGASGSSRQPWPSRGIEKWMNIVLSYSLDNSGDIVVSTFLLCATLEMLLEDLLCNIFDNQGAKHAHAEILIDTHQGFTRRVELFKKLIGVPFKEAIETSCGENDFYDKWSELNRSRSYFIHGGTPVSYSKKMPSKDALTSVRDKMLSVFACLNNKFAIQSEKA